MPFSIVKAIENLTALHDFVYLAEGNWRLAIGYWRGDFNTWLLDVEIAIRYRQLWEESVIYEVVILAKR